MLSRGFVLTGLCVFSIRQIHFDSLARVTCLFTYVRKSGFSIGCEEICGQRIGN